MKYFLDTEFHEYKKKPLFGKTIDTIELISIGIVADDDRSYYAICKDFDIKAAWNKWQPRMGQGDRNNIEPREYWIRENVLKSIWIELHQKELASDWRKNQLMIASNKGAKDHFCYRSLKRLIDKYGKTRVQIAEEITEFVDEGLDHITTKFTEADAWDERFYPKEFKYISDNNTFIPKTVHSSGFDNIGYALNRKLIYNQPEFYAYYADYDWVVFCWLFGRMIDLPKGFPMYCKDLKQLVDEHFKINRDLSEYIESCIDCKSSCTLEDLKSIFHEKLNLPKQESEEHNALADAKWNKELYEFLINLK